MKIKPCLEDPRKEYRKLDHLQNEEIVVSEASIYSVKDSIGKVKKLFRQIYEISPNLPFTDFVLSCDQTFEKSQEICLSISLKLDAKEYVCLKDFYKFFAFLMDKAEFEFELTEEKTIQIELLPDNKNRQLSDRVYLFLSLNSLFKVGLVPYPADDRNWLRIEFPMDQDALEFLFRVFRNKHNKK